MPPAQIKDEETACSERPSQQALETEPFHINNNNSPDGFNCQIEGIFHEHSFTIDGVHRPSNERLLATAFLTFLSFASIQLVFAFIADSQAMKGDSAAMMVDSMTYLFNWLAEHRKNHYDWNGVTGESTLDSVQAQKRRERAYRKMVLQMEILPPLLSVSTLLAVTSVVIYQAVLVLLRGHVPAASRHPNLHLMMGFSLFNLGLDFLNVFCFARAKHLTGYSTTADDDDDDEEACCDYHQNQGDTNGDCRSTSSSHAKEEEHPNLNMCSAYTHVLADTLRSFAVIIAALTAFITPGVTPEQADATAAIVVSGMIALSLVPLFKGLVNSIRELRGILREERTEALLEESSSNM